MKNKAITGIRAFVLLIVFLSYIMPIYDANASGINTWQQLNDPLKGKTFLQLAQGIIKGIRQIAVPVAVIMVITSGILFMISRGDPGKTTTARQMLTYTLIGFAIILVGEGFLALIRSILELGS